MQGTPALVIMSFERLVSPLALGAKHGQKPSYLLLPIASIAFHGGPMKTKPACVHFRANSEFSLNYETLSLIYTTRLKYLPTKP